MRLDKKVAIVTGGGTGIGEAIAKLFAKEGARVVITGRRKEPLEKVVKEISKAGGNALAVPGSVTNEADVQRAVESAIKSFGKVDILVNNAGSLFKSESLQETTDELWNETIDIFLTGVFRFSRAVIPAMVRQGGGSIVNISTIAGLKASSGWSMHAYSAAKAGVNMLTKTIAIEYAKKNIRCNAVCPAGVVTPGVEEMISDPKNKAGMDAFHPLGRMGVPEEIAPAVLYFASDESRWTTGSILTVDGGVMAQ
jgi:NAD(P)-dependent dehydrogenase (short-subunit alcohol dehydrogenase family)